MPPELHPDAQEFIDRAEGSPAPQELPVDEARRAQRERAIPAGEPEPVARVDDVVVRGDGHGIPVRIYEPRGGGDERPVLVWAHGGAFVLGDVDTEDATARAVANASGCLVLSVDYRLAPEHRFPAALRDVYDVVAWAASSIEAHGGDPDRLAVGGQSSGANLAAATALLARDVDGPSIAAQVLVVPALDYSLEAPDRPASADDSKRWTSHELYLADPLHGHNEYAFPLLASEHRGLPPATVVTAGADRHKHDGRAYVSALEAAAVDVSHHHFADMIHLFFGQLQDPEWERAREAVERVGEDIQRLLA